MTPLLVQVCLKYRRLCHRCHDCYSCLHMLDTDLTLTWLFLQLQWQATPATSAAIPATIATPAMIATPVTVALTPAKIVTPVTAASTPVTTHFLIINTVYPRRGRGCAQLSKPKLIRFQQCQLSLLIVSWGQFPACGQSWNLKIVVLSFLTFTWLRRTLEFLKVMGQYL